MASMHSGGDSEGSSINFKVCMLGDCGVGKTCIVNRLCKGTFEDSAATIGAAFNSKVFRVINEH